MDGARITYAPCPDATSEGELAALAAVYKFILDSQAWEGGSHDLTNDIAPNSLETEGISQDKKGIEKNGSVHS